MDKAALVWCPCPDRETARSLASSLLEEKLIACGNILTGVESVFEWQGEVSRSEEVAVLLKTTSAKLDMAVVRLGELHPYETPAIIGWECGTAHPATLGWLGETLR